MTHSGCLILESILRGHGPQQSVDSVPTGRHVDPEKDGISEQRTWPASKAAIRCRELRPAQTDTYVCAHSRGGVDAYKMLRAALICATGLSWSRLVCELSLSELVVAVCCF